LTVHPYRGYLSDSGFVKELREAAALVGNRPVWITEMGWSTQIGGKSERQQARLLARCYLGALASGACQNVSWYDFRCDGNDPFYNEHNFGVLRHDLSPKAGYRALATICRTFVGGKPNTPDFCKELRAVAMGDAMAVWSSRQYCRQSFRIVSGAPTFRNLMGETLDPPREDDVVTLDLPLHAAVIVEGGRLEPVGGVTLVEGPAELRDPINI